MGSLRLPGISANVNTALNIKFGASKFRNLNLGSDLMKELIIYTIYGLWIIGLTAYGFFVILTNGG